ncbi:MAG: hypothetical protein Q9187_009152, partial [Circinaria calcarea]
RQLKRRDIRTEESIGASQTRSTSKASEDIDTAADHLLRVALGSADLPQLSERIDTNSPVDGDGISVLLQAAAQMEESSRTTPLLLSTIPDTEGESGPDAQPRSPLFFSDDSDFKRERDISGDMETPSPDHGQTSGVTRYEFPFELVEMRCSSPVERRLRHLYRRSLLVRRPDGRRPDGRRVRPGS